MEKMGNFVRRIDDIRNNLKTMRNYLVSQKDEERSFAREKLRRGYNLVGAIIDGDVIFGPSRVVGYKRITFQRHLQLGENDGLDGKETNPAINRVLGEQIKRGQADWQQIEELFLRLCEKVDVVPVNRSRKFWVLDGLGSKLAVRNKTYSEGALSFNVSSRYERNLRARRACIEAHGTTCVVCDFNFEQAYGEHGKGFIHVHHLQPLNKARAGDQTDPAKDLVPVCPNCHYMLHRGDQLLSPKALKKIMKHNE